MWRNTGWAWLLAGSLWAGGVGSAIARGDEAPAAEAGAHGHEAPKGPMTATKPDIDLAIWTLVTFGTFLFVLSKVAWKPLVDGLDKRELSIRDDLAAAEDARHRAEKMLAEHQAKLGDTANEVRAMLDEARKDAEHTKNDIVAAAQKEAEASKQRALVEIEQAKDQALNDLFEVMARTVSAATEQVVGRALSGEDQDRMIREAVESFAKQAKA
jgi:F-type H+-transporting ATPase subunit b